MWWRNVEPEDPSYGARERRYRRHMARRRRKLPPEIYRWFSEDVLHDDRLEVLAIDFARQTLRLSFHHMGAWVQHKGRFVAPAPEQRIFRFAGVTDFRVVAPAGVTLAHSEYIRGELDTHPELRRPGGAHSLAMILVGGSDPEESQISFRFDRLAVRVVRRRRK